jgi:hypothetical protein
MIEMRPFKVAPTVKVFLAALAALSAPAVARRAPADWERNTPIAIRALHDFARCVARNHWSRGRARQLLLMDDRTDDYRAALRALAVEHGECVAPNHILSFNLLLFAGGIAEAVLPQDRDLAVLVAYDPARPPIRSRDEIEVMSLCTVRAAPAGIRALLATVPASAEESAALRALAPQLGQCLRVGARTRLNRLEIRALLALAAWRLSEHNSEPRPTSTNMAQPDQPAAR